MVKRGTIVSIKDPKLVYLSYWGEEEGKRQPSRRALRGLWVIDDILEGGCLNISTFEYPIPGAFCSYTTISNVVEVKVPSKKRRLGDVLRDG